ncbi:MAG TPA: preprotein translocase subunit YajC [Ruminococcaceae bacterium]|nr:preprotein translocase subunit YajC [Oscillospiraceae bacterium]
MNFINLISSASSADAGAAAGSQLASILMMIVPLALMIGVFYFLILRPEKKRNKEMQAMLNNIQVADEVVTSGGIIGRVLSVKEDTVLIETGSDRTKIRVLKSAIARNNTQHEAASAEVESAKASKDKSGKTEIK